MIIISTFAKDIQDVPISLPFLEPRIWQNGHLHLGPQCTKWTWCYVEEDLKLATETIKSWGNCYGTKYIKCEVGSFSHKPTYKLTSFWNQRRWPLLAKNAGLSPFCICFTFRIRNLCPYYIKLIVFRHYFSLITLVKTCALISISSSQSSWVKSCYKMDSGTCSDTGKRRDKMQNIRV